MNIPITYKWTINNRVRVNLYKLVKPTDKLDHWVGKSLVLTNIGGKLYKKTIIGL